MRRLLLIIPAVAFLLISLSCNKECIARNTPSCIRNSIKTEIENPHSMIGIVDEYQFQGNTVYAFNYNLMADGGIEIKDASCNTLCHVGGFGGPAVDSCNGDKFFQAAVLKRNIWTR